MRKFNRKALVYLMETLVLNYNKAIVHPGEMVGTDYCTKYWRTCYTNDT